MALRTAGTALTYPVYPPLTAARERKQIIITARQIKTIPAHINVCTHLHTRLSSGGVTPFDSLAILSSAIKESSAGKRLSAYHRRI